MRERRVSAPPLWRPLPRAHMRTGPSCRSATVVWRLRGQGRRGCRGERGAHRLASSSASPRATSTSTSELGDPRGHLMRSEGDGSRAAQHHARPSLPCRRAHTRPSHAYTATARRRPACECSPRRYRTPTPPRPATRPRAGFGNGAAAAAVQHASAHHGATPRAGLGNGAAAAAAATRPNLLVLLDPEDGLVVPAIATGSTRRGERSLGCEAL